MAPYIPEQQINTGLFVPTTNNWDIENIESIDVNSREFKELFVRLYQNMNAIALSLNAKESAYYLNEEFNTGKLFFNPASSSPLDLRPVFRKVVDAGPLNLGIKAIAHDLAIENTWKFTKIEGCASLADAVGHFFPFPYAGPPPVRISVIADNLNVVINNLTPHVFPYAYVVLEYVKY
jgi:hypothetical protein